ncbi:MAG: hypothetical protein IPI73_27815 [Betaproteobacteria bacterium]|nr:hypothetical protein [Betaproteobacteria bacterium]
MHSSIAALALGLGLVACATATGARADSSASPQFLFSGFGTFGVVHSSERNADFTYTAVKPRGAGFSRNWSPEIDSLIAAQVSASFTPALSAVVQVIAEQNYDHSYRPHIEWANIKYQFTPDFSVRAGRIVLPIFMAADTRKIGYANPWVRQPVEVYSLAPISTSDGLDASYRLQLGAATNSLQASIGREDKRFPSATAKARALLTVVNTIEHGYATLRVSYARARITISDFDPLFDAFRQFGPEGTALADKYNVNARLMSLIGVGAGFDPGPWFVQGEWSRVDGRSIFGRKSAWYVGGGYRFGKLTPYAAYAAAKADNLSDPGLALSNLPPYLAGPASGLNAGLNELLRVKLVQDTLTVGARWDFVRNAALKVQFEHTRIGAGSTGGLGNLQPGFRPGGSLNVISATIDFVF